MNSAALRAAVSAFAAAWVLAGCGGATVNLNIWPFKKDGTPTESTGTVSAPVAASEPAVAAKPTPAPAPGPAPEPAAVLIPVVATGYACEGNRRLHVRPLDEGALWLTLPERELRLEKAPVVLNRYMAGRVVLELGEKTATVTDGPVKYTGCKAAEAR